MEELKRVIAGNIGTLRREANMTQLELAERLNYSDKAVSKWERGESIPDVATLKQVADMFGVTVDYLLRPDHPAETDAKREYTRRQRRNHRLITALSCVTVFFLATFAFFGADLAVTGEPIWLSFLYAVPVSQVVLLVFNSIWGNRRRNFLIISVLVWSVLLCVFLTALVLFDRNIWLLFTLGIPIQVIIALWAGLRLK